MMAKKALQRNGKLFGNLMIGVVPCTDLTVGKTKNTEKEKETHFNIYKPKPVNNSYSVETLEHSGPKPYTSYWNKIMEYVIGI